MKPRFGILGYPGKIKNAYKHDYEYSLKKAGWNYGNLLFMHAIGDVLTSLGCECIYINEENTDSWQSIEVVECLDKLIIPASNFITTDYNLADLYHFIGRTSCKLCVLGLGTQIDPEEDLENILPEENLKLLRLLSSRSIYLGVRGKRTERALAKLGIGNIKVIGCPSNFLRYNDPSFIESIHSRYKMVRSGVSRIMCAGDEPYSHDYISEFESKLFKWVDQYGGTYVIQSVKPLLSLITKNSVECENELKDALKIYDKFSQHMAFRKKFFQLSRVYISVEQWLFDAAQHDLCLGRRFHGNMFAFQAGCPAIWFGHDVRTNELIAELVLPSMKISDFINAGSIDEVVQSLEFDLESYTCARSRLYQSFLEVVFCD